MKVILRLRASACCAVLGVFVMLSAGAAQADPAVPLAKAGTAAVIDEAIEREKKNRALAIAGIAVSGAVILGGTIVSTIASVENRDNRDSGNPRRHNVYVGYAVGLGVGLPIAGLSAYFFSQAQHRLNVLRQERLSVSYLPDSHQPVLQLTFNF